LIEINIYNIYCVYKLLHVVARMSANGLCVTSAGDLPANYIIHVVAEHDSRGWKTVIANCLRQAETNNFNSIAFPLLGTGTAGLSD